MNYAGYLRDTDGNKYYTQNRPRVQAFYGDLNNVKETGFIYAQGNASNIPLSGYSFYVTTIALNDYYIHQQASRVSDETKFFEIYERQCYGGSWTTWRKKSGYTLYDNTDGSNGTITLSDSAANYNKIKIYFRADNYRYGSTEIYLPNGKYVSLLINTNVADSASLVLKSKTISISGTTISNLAYSMNVIATSVSSVANDYIYIYRVEGYK